MCGVVGVVAHTAVNQRVFDALTVLQHRGQNAAGIATLSDGHMDLQKGNGLVRDVFHTREMQALRGNAGIGHVRYPTAGTMDPAEAQPFYVNAPYGIVLAHNGNLVNAAELRSALVQDDARHLNTASDSEVLLNVLAHALHARRQPRATAADFFHAVTEVHARVQGGYAVVALIAGHGLLAFRDPHGIRPLAVGVRHTPLGVEGMVASESVALQHAGFSLLEDCRPGEAIWIALDGTMERQICAPVVQRRPCLFELVYFARPDSVMDGISVYQFRRAIGARLAAEIQEAWGPTLNIDVVIPVPETSRHAAWTLAEALGCAWSEGLVKNRYIGRTFIMPGQAVRQRSVRQKLNVIASEFAGRHVLLVDDSIVRGTTSREIVEMAKDAGALSVSMASTAPPVRFQNGYGIDIPSCEELVAHGRTLEEIRAYIGADRLIYLSLGALKAAAHACNPEIEAFEASVFDGAYIAGVPAGQRCS